MKKDIRKSLISYALLTIITLLLLLLPLGTEYFFGSEGDWYSQHVAIAESIRQTMLETGKLIPQFIRLGGVSNIYDFAYYGLLRPDILFSCLVPELEMKYIIAGYAVLGVVVSVNLCFRWLKAQNITGFFAFFGAVLLAASACFYQAHHQIMFVNYMPYLLLALMGADRLLDKRRAGLLIFSLFMIYIHSFYYSVSCLFVVGIYVLHQLLQTEEVCGLIALRQTKRLAAIIVKEVGRLIAAAALSIGLAAVLLVPTAIDIFSNEKDGGSFSVTSLKLLDGGLGGLLYTPYGCGMTLVVLYCLLLSLTKRRKRFLSAVLLVCILFPAVSYVLNGFLYARPKILIPFVLLFVLLAADTLSDLYHGGQKHSLPLLACCLIPAFFSSYTVLVCIDIAVLLLWLLIWKLGGLSAEKKRGAVGKCVFSIVYLVPILFNLFLNLSDSYLNPVCVRLGVHAGGAYIKKEEGRQQHFTLQEISDFAKDGEYRFDVLANNFVNSNLLADGRINKTAMYSSVTNTVYGRFCYDTMKNPISVNNRVALLPSTNPFFLYFMGQKYLLTDKANVPEGYEIEVEKDGYALVKNEDVLPVCYGTVRLLSEEEYGRLDFPETLEKLCSCAVVPDNGINILDGGTGQDGKAADGESSNTGQASSVKELDTDEFFKADGKDKLMEPSGKEESYVVDLAEPISGRILIIRFHVESRDGRAVELRINGIKNKLSAKSAPYPNRNNDFTYILSAVEPLKQLNVDASEGSYSVEDLCIYTVDVKALHHDIVSPKSDKNRREDGRNVYKGQITMDRDGYFITSYPYRKGYRIEVDGEQVEACRVNTAFVGFPIEEGKHSIEIAYEAPGFRVGLIISMVSLIIGLCHGMKTIF